MRAPTGAAPVVVRMLGGGGAGENVLNALEAARIGDGLRLEAVS